MEKEFDLFEEVVELNEENDQLSAYANTNNCNC